MKLHDVLGQSFGRLTVLSKSDMPRMWVCLCECGNETLAASSALRSGRKRSCGCLLREWSKFLGSHRPFVSQRIAKTTRHGHKRVGNISPEYRTWLGMKRRCSDPGFKDYANWGGRGISVCDRWNKSFDAFLADMGPKPGPEWSIDRIDHDGPYSPDNCHWTLQHMQAAEHTRRCEAITVQGVEYPSVNAACRAYGLGASTVSNRRKIGMVGDAVFTTPLRKTKTPAQLPPPKIGFIAP